MASVTSKLSAVNPKVNYMICNGKSNWKVPRMAEEMVPMVTDMCIQCRNVLSFAKLI